MRLQLSTVSILIEILIGLWAMIIMVSISYYSYLSLYYYFIVNCCLRFTIVNYMHLVDVDLSSLQHTTLNIRKLWRMSVLIVLFCIKNTVTYVFITLWGMNWIGGMWFPYWSILSSAFIVLLSLISFGKKPKVDRSHNNINLAHALCMVVFC